ncbi:beta-lactamase-like protein [Dunaliella salina]|nr:beta-lactamase-like protein [Dunaliella salina]|eukprot:KAF5840784.1 beta-lactamase-like protein [Dunaliella salina]
MGSMLMDCGEGSWGQMLRCLGPEAARQQVAALRCVWVSHKHADHALGLSGLLAARPASAPPLLVVGPWAVKRWMHLLHDNHGYRTHFVHCREFRQPCDMANNVQQSVQAEALGPRGLGLVRWQSVPVNHCPDAYALVMEHQHGWKLVYSGDTRPCPALVRAGAGATLLIHEATFEPELEHQAVSKKHSTSAEALQAAKDMKAYSTILTHFSQRYPRVPAGLGLESESEDPEGQETLTAGDLPAQQEAAGGVEQGCGHCACGSSESEEDELEGNREGVVGPRGWGEEEENPCAAGKGTWRGLEGRASKAQENGACSKDEAGSEQGYDGAGAGGKSEDQCQAQRQQQQQQQPQQQQCQSQLLGQGEAQGLRTAPAMVAFDGMLVPLSVLPHLPMVGPLVAKVLKRAEQL